MPGQQDRHIGREIISLLMGPVLPAPGASRHRFEEAMKELRIVTTRASASRAAGHRLPTGGWKRKVFAFRSEEHTSELQSLMRISYAVFCLKKKKQHKKLLQTHHLPTQQQRTHHHLHD